MSDRLAGKSLVYFGLYDAREAPGVDRKVNGVLAAARSIGFETRAWSEPFVGTQPLRRLGQAIDEAAESHLILRSLGFANLLLMPALLRARRRGMHVTIDVASPNRVAIREIWNSRQSLWRRCRTVVALIMSGPWALWPASRIVQYAPEGWWFRLGNRSRTFEIGNGIDVSAIEPRRRTPPWPAPVLEVLAVASVAEWHGFDRLLRAVAEFHAKPDRTFDLHLTIAGDGPALGALRECAASLQLFRQVTFAGTVTGPALQQLYESAHIAVSSLGLHRIGLARASVLKAREYSAIGIPFIASGGDVDFDDGPQFRLRVGADESTGELVQIFADFSALSRNFDAAAERHYAEARLDWRRKLHAFGLEAP